MPYKDPEKRREKQREYSRRYDEKNPEKRREQWSRYAKKSQEKRTRYMAAYKRKQRYGVTSEEYDAILKDQDGCCAICGSDNPRHKTKSEFDLDHCHATGAIRGVLCSPCNRALGLFQDDPEVLQRAIDYLKRRPIKSG